MNAFTSINARLAALQLELTTATLFLNDARDHVAASQREVEALSRVLRSELHTLEQSEEE